MTREKRIQAAKALGEAVRARRKALGLTQLQLSLFAGCGLAFIYELETGKPTVRLDKLLDILEVLGLELLLTDGSAGLRVPPQSNAARGEP